MDTDEHDHEPEHGHVHAPAQEGEGLLRLEARPRRLIAARYERLPFPHLGPVQEIALDLGIYPVELRFMHDVAAEFTVTVVREGEGWSDAEARAARKAAAQVQQEA